MHKPSLPESLARLMNDEVWSRITVGMSGADTFRLTASSHNRYMKIQSASSVESLWQEKERLIWLQGKLPVPKVLGYDKDTANEYLLISEIEGLDASDPSYESMLPQVMRQLAIGLRTIHQVKIDNCPFDQRLDRKIPEAKRRVDNKQINEHQFDEVRQGSRAEQLLEELMLKKPADEDLVFTHGDYCLPNIVLKDGVISGFVDWGRAGIADRYQDIALAIRSITYNFGEQQVGYFLEAYGLPELDESKVSYYQLLDEFF
jgi:aminoglycoside phosphotransferase